MRTRGRPQASIDQEAASEFRGRGSRATTARRRSFRRGTEQALTRSPATHPAIHGRKKEQIRELKGKPGLYIYIGHRQGTKRRRTMGNDYTGGRWACEGDAECGMQNAGYRMRARCRMRRLKQRPWRRAKGRCEAQQQRRRHTDKTMDGNAVAVSDEKQKPGWRTQRR